MRACEFARSASSRRSARWFRLLPQHGFGFEQAGLDLRIGSDEVVDRLAQKREIVLQAADLFEAIDQVGETDPDQFVLLPDRVELAVGARRAPGLPEERAALRRAMIERTASSMPVKDPGPSCRSGI